MGVTHAKKEGQYDDYDQEARTNIARYSIESGVARANQTISADLGRMFSETYYRINEIATSIYYIRYVALCMLSTRTFAVSVFVIKRSMGTEILETYNRYNLPLLVNKVIIMICICLLCCIY